MSRERLEEIKKNVTYIYNGVTERADCVDLNEKDYEWLIEQAEEAKRIPMLETAVQRLRDKRDKLEVDCEGLRVALRQHASVAVEAEGRVQELEKELNQYKDYCAESTNYMNFSILKEENKRLREALEEIAKETFLNGDSHYATQQKLIRVILNARQALEVDHERD